jgi:hypothetical protein
MENKVATSTTKPKVGLKIWDELPTWSKGVIAVGGLVAVYFAITQTLKRIKQAEANKKNREIIDKVEDDIETLEKQGMKLTYMPSQYNQWSDAIAKTFSGCDWEQPLFPTGFSPWLPIGFVGWSGSGAKLANIMLKIKNDLDFAQLSASYGIRTYDQCGFWPFSGEFTGSLPSAVSDELSEGEIVAINNYLKAQGITYRF